MSDNTVLWTHTFDERVVSYTESFLNDLVIDQIDQVAYISNPTEGSLIVYDRDSDMARAFKGSSTLADERLEEVTIKGHQYSDGIKGIGIDGIGLHPNLCRVYYAPLWSDHIYSVPTSALRNFELSDEEINAQVIDHGVRPGTFSDGFAFDSNGNLYFGGIGDSSLYAWDVNTSLANALPIVSDTARQIKKETDRLNWIDTFGFDDRGGLLFTSNKLQYFLTHETYNENVSNFRVMRAEIEGLRSYLYGQIHRCEEAI